LFLVSSWQPQGGPQRREQEREVVREGWK